MSLSSEQLHSILLDNNFVEPKDLEEAQELAQTQKISLYEAILEKNFLSDENLGKVIADYYKIPYVNLSKVVIPEVVLKIIPENVAQKHKIIAYKLDNTGIAVATANPENIEVIKQLEKKTKLPINLHYATERNILEIIYSYKQQLQSAITELLQEPGSSRNGLIGVPVIKIVSTIIQNAYYSKASDVHLEPHTDQSLVRFRIDGILHDSISLPRSLHDQVVTRIKVESRLRTDEHQSAQDGRMKFKMKDEEIDIRVSIVPIVEGEKCVLRLLSSHMRQYGLSDIGFSDSDNKKVENAFNKPYGMILSTGPTGSGKTTSMYSILKILNSRDVNIATIEDPVEYEVEGLNQIQVNTKTNLTFAEGLRSILRQDPDIIYVGEIRDKETADIAINSAMTGHLVLSTLHTNDAGTSLPRLIDMDIEPFLIASTVNIIIAQRLIRKICDKCRVSYTETAENLQKHISESEVKKCFGGEGEIRLYMGKGCPVCHNTGYIGRIGIFEVLEVNEEIKDLIMKKVNAEEITQKARELGMTTMLEDGLEKVKQGITTVEEILRATKE
ncbi:MAG: Flp pilus assembly complex ATPase component TadA [bacterium]|nr:Flp pilus assembly complex ATPase component TadA [bacterium]